MVQRYEYFAASEEFEPFDRGDWVKYEDYAALKKERDALMKLHELAYNEPNNDEAMHWVNQAVNNLEAWLDE